MHYYPISYVYLYVYFDTAFDCGPLPSINGGAVEYSQETTFESVATYTCDAGFELVGGGMETRTCTETGEWSGDEPTCQGN